MLALETAQRVRERFAPRRFHAPSLDALNFLTADVRGALGPFVTVYLATDRHWDLATAGLVMTLGGWFGLAAQTPLGALLDATERKRELVAAALLLLAGGALVVALWPDFWPVLAANTWMQVVSGVFDPAIAALTVGLFARRDLTWRMGRNAAFARAGNLTIAVLAGFVAWRFSARGVFFMVPVFALIGIVAALSIPHGAIDLRRARGLRSGEQEEGGPAGWRALARCRPLVIFGLCTLLFDFSMAPLLTLAGQRLGVLHDGLGIVMTSACIVAQQAGMLPAALLMGRRADRWGHKLMLAGGFALVPVQGVLLALLGDGTAWLIGLQFLGGLGVGLYSAMIPLLLADVTQGTGHYNLAQGVVATLRSLGAASSGLAAELVVARLGYDAAFLGCAGIGAAALALLWFAMPETRPELK
jgi:MFS family permease